MKGMDSLLRDSSHPDSREDNGTRAAGLEHPDDCCGESTVTEQEC
jgi:hypothetical protein